MAHVVVTDITPRIVYSASTGVTYVIPSTWAWFNLTDFQVYLGSTEISYATSPTSSTQFATSGTLIDGGYNGGNIVLGAVTTEAVTVIRNVPASRTSDFTYPSGTLNIKTLNTDLDKIVAVQQQILRDQDRVIVQGPSDTGTIGTMGAITDRAGKFLTFDANGTISFSGLTLSGTTATISAFMTTFLGATDETTALAAICGASTSQLGTAAALDTGSSSSNVVVNSNGSGLLQTPYDMAFRAGYSTTGGTENIVVQEYDWIVAPRNLTVTGEQGYIETAGSTSPVIVDIEVNGTSIYNSTSKPQFVSTNSITAGTLTNTTITAGDRVDFKVTQIGSTGTPGAGLRFSLLAKLR